MLVNIFQRPLNYGCGSEMQNAFLCFMPIPYVLCRPTCLRCTLRAWIIIRSINAMLTLTEIHRSHGAIMNMINAKERTAHTICMVAVCSKTRLAHLQKCMSSQSYTQSAAVRVPNCDSFFFEKWFLFSISTPKIKKLKHFEAFTLAESCSFRWVRIGDAHLIAYNFSS